MISGGRMQAQRAMLRRPEIDFMLAIGNNARTAGTFHGQRGHSSKYSELIDVLGVDGHATA